MNSKIKENWDNVCSYIAENNIDFIAGPGGVYVPDFKDEKLLKRYLGYHKAYMEELVNDIKVQETT